MSTPTIVICKLETGPIDVSLEFITASVEARSWRFADLMNCSIITVFCCQLGSFVTVLSGFFRAAVPEDSNFVDPGLDIDIFRCFHAFFRRSETRGFWAECGAHPAGGKSTRRAYQATIPVDLLHEQAHKLMSSMALSRLDVLGLSTDHSLHRLNSVAADSSDTTSRRRITFSKTQCLHSCIPGDGARCQVSLLSRCLQFCWVCLLPAWFLR